MFIQRIKILVNNSITLIKTYDLLLAFIIAFSIVIIGITLGFENNKVVPVNPASSAHYLNEPHNLLKFMVNWDGPNYISIAQNGYRNTAQTNFFPLYPILIKTLNSIFHSYINSSLTISIIGFIGALYFYIKIIKKRFKVTKFQEIIKAVALFALFPTSVFMFSAYTEGLFAFLALMAIYLVIIKRYYLATIPLFFLGLTHVNAVLVIAMLMILLYENKQSIFKIIIFGAISSLGFISYLIYMKNKFGNYFAFLAAQKNHSWWSLSLSHFITGVTSRDGLFFILLFITSLYWFNKQKSFSIYALFYIIIAFFTNNTFSGLARYSLMAFPIEFMLYDYFKDKKTGYLIVIIISTIMWTYFVTQYAGGYTGG